MPSDKKDFNTGDILSQVDYAGIIYRRDSDAVYRADAEYDDYKVKDFIKTNDFNDTNVATVEIDEYHYNTYNENDTIYYFITTKCCDLMPASIHSGRQPRILRIDAGSVMFIPKKSDHTFIGTFKAIVITLPK